jgi:transcriptional regulator with XRE-family HTH domain
MAVGERLAAGGSEHYDRYHQADGQELKAESHMAGRERKVSPGVNPTAELRRLRAELRRLREAAGLTQQQVADDLEWSLSKVIRIETGVVGISMTDLRALLIKYGMNDTSETERLAGMARAARQDGWWTKYRSHFSRKFLTFLGLEASATEIRQYHQSLVPALLQTRDYTQAVLRVWTDDVTAVSLGTEVRMERQRLLAAGGPKMIFIVDEAVVRRLVGGYGVMRQQLERLKEINQLPNVSIRVAEFDKGAHKGMKESFEILEFASDEDDYAVYVDGQYNNTLIQNSPEEASSYLQDFYDLQDIATSDSETERILDEILAGWQGRYE